MKRCDWCRQPITYFSIGHNGKTYCDIDCRNAAKREEIEIAAEGIERASDFKDWSKRDLSEVFWIHLGKYIKNPNQYSLSIIQRAYSWATHDDHGLSNSFKHALDWAKIDIWKESPVNTR